MEDDLTRAQRYRALSLQMRAVADHEPDERRRRELSGLAEQYERIADRLIFRRGSQP
jgi:hypothetical protein